jgi:hypothetical protein
MVESKKQPDDAHLAESQKLLEEMDALLKRVRILMLNHLKPKLVETDDDNQK